MRQVNRRLRPRRIVLVISPDYPEHQHVINAIQERPDAEVRLLGDPREVDTPERIKRIKRIKHSGDGVTQEVEYWCFDAAAWADELVLFWSRHHFFNRAVLKAFHLQRRVITVFYPDGRWEQHSPGQAPRRAFNPSVWTWDRAEGTWRAA